MDKKGGKPINKAVKKLKKVIENRSLISFA